ncbi:MAG TPA: TIGR03619 family F420-dependent LLM class oxidoreductase [Deltaproteobacteria bacterium]|nr:TIGR03619 family F420-dependent LLM class oxidoreductase [Candidatus Binatota bacterium]HIL13754.1 TIGR03619 family F420-dependent LLM class oxidoreductase [Deltaproteobacteria bacterium]
MRFSYAESMTDPTFFPALARAAEDSGWDGFIVPDSICYPEVSDSKYPYTPDGDRGFLEDKPFIEPFTLVPALAAVTSRLRFQTFVIKLPVRHPVLVAKQASSVAVLSDNRFSLGVGVSPWPDDYRVMDEPWPGRGRRMNEMMEIIRGLCEGGFFEYHGEFYDIESIKICPVPSKPLPLLVGGHSEAALKRAARLGDGWMHAGGDPAELESMIARLHELRKEYGREQQPFEVHVISLDAYSVDGARRLQDAGVTDCIVGFRNSYERGVDTEPLQVKIDALRVFADDVIAASRR